MICYHARARFPPSVPTAVILLDYLGSVTDRGRGVVRVIVMTLRFHVLA
jgi:hypothetical protein